MSIWVKLNSENLVMEALQYDGDSPDWLVEKFGGQWMETDQPAGPSIPEIGKTWYPEWGVFLWGKPFDSWVYDADAKDWRAPESYPVDGNSYFWNESNQSWDEVPTS